MLKPLFLLSVALPAPLFAQAAPAVPATIGQSPPAARNAAPAPAPVEEVEEIVVYSARERGSVDGDIPPEVQLDAGDIEALGAGSVADLLAALGPELRSGRGRGDGPPVVLVDGRRVSGFQEIRNYPPEAIERVDILPEEVALRYGFRADQRVINFVLRQQFQSVTLELDPKLATRGGWSELEVEAGMLRIRDGRRISLEGEYSRQSMLRESERDVVGEAADDPAVLARNAAERSLLPRRDALELGGTWAGVLTEGVDSSFNARFEAAEQRSLNGLPSAALASGAAADPLERVAESWNGRLGTALNGRLGTWRWSFTGFYDLSNADTLTDRDVGQTVRTDLAESRSGQGNADLLLSGGIAELPAGQIATSLKMGFDRRDLSSRSVIGPLVTDVDLGRSQGLIQASVDVPLARRSREVLPVLGDLSVNGNIAVESLSDFGTLATFGYGMTWQPVKMVTIIASGTHEQGAPGIQQLGNPLVATPNVRVFDFQTGQTVDITRIDGGNQDLLADSRRVWKLGLNLQPIDGTDFSVRADFVDSRLTNPIAGFPTATPEIEAAFPDRFIRDSEGRLLSIDNRPVNFARQDRQELRWGINWSQTLKPTASERAAMEARRAEMEKQMAARAAAAPSAGTPAAARPAGGPPRGRGGLRPGEGRLNLTLFHTVKFREEILIRDGVPVLDLLDGSATGNRGGVSRHEVEARLFGVKNGMGGRLSANWRSGTTVETDPGGMNSPDDLFFSPFLSTDLRFFVDFGQRPGVVRKHPFLRGARLALSIDNLFDNQQQVRSRQGVIPVGFQPDLLDPLGRTVSISFRKIFLPGFRPAPAASG